MLPSGEFSSAMQGALDVSTHLLTRVEVGTIQVRTNWCMVCIAFTAICKALVLS